MGWKTEDGIRNRQIVFTLESKEEEFVGLAVSNPVFDKDSLSEMVIVANLGVKVAENDQFIISDRTVALRDSKKAFSFR